MDTASALDADAMAQARSLKMGSPSTNPGRAGATPRICRIDRGSFVPSLALGRDQVDSEARGNEDARLDAGSPDTSVRAEVATFISGKSGVMASMAPDFARLRRSRRGGGAACARGAGCSQLLQAARSSRMAGRYSV